MGSNRAFAISMAIIAVALLVFVLRAQREPVSPTATTTAVASSTVSACSPPRAVDCGLGPYPKTGTATTALLEGARVVPSFRNGKAVGFKVFGIRPDSLFQGVGLQNGDVVVRIGGVSIEDPQAALDALNRVRCKDTFTVELLRDDEAITLGCRNVTAR